MGGWVCVEGKGECRGVVTRGRWGRPQRGRGDGPRSHGGSSALTGEELLVDQRRVRVEVHPLVRLGWQGTVRDGHAR